MSKCRANLMTGGFPLCDLRQDDAQAAAPSGPDTESWEFSPMGKVGSPAEAWAGEAGLPFVLIARGGDGGNAIRAR